MASPSVDPPATTQRSLVMVFALFVGGCWAGYALLHRIDAAAEFKAVQTQYDIFALLMAAVVGLAFAGFAVSSIWLKRLTDLLATEGRNPAFGAIFLIALLVVVVVLSLSVVLEGQAELDTQLSRQLRPITVVAAIGVMPGLAGFVTIHAVASQQNNWCDATDSCHVRLLNRLNSELHRLLTTFAAILTLWVVATGMRRQALLAADDTVSRPIEEVLIFGLAFALVLGSLYLVAATAIDRRATILSEMFAPLPDTFADNLSDSIRRREQMEQLFGIGSDARRSFGSVVVIASPLLTAIIASALSSG